MAGITALTLAIIGVFREDLSRQHTIRQIAILAGKPYANVHAAVQRMLEQHLLTKQTVGSSHLCGLNLANEETILLVSLWHAHNTSPLPTTHAYLQRDPNVLMIWKRETDILVITKTPVKTTHNNTVFRTWKQLPQEHQLTLGKHALLTGHTTYAALLSRGDRE